MKHQEVSAGHYFRITSLLPKLLLTCLFVFLLQITSFGAVFVVTKTADTNDGVCDSDCSLREAIAAAGAAASDDVIEFDAKVFGITRTIALSNGSLVIANNGSLTVNGPGRQLLTINGNNNTIVFIVSGSASGGANLSINGVTVTGGNPGFLTLGTLTVTDVSITGNGGGIVNDVGPLTINNSIISNNTSNLGAGVQNRFSDNSIHPTMVINDSIISNNSSTGSGGGISNPQTGSVTLNNSIVTGNTAVAGGGIVNAGILILNNSHVDQNTSTGTASAAGGGIQHFFGTLTAVDSTINGNLALAAGGGINNDDGTLNLTNTLISGNTSTNRDAGGIYNSRGTVTLNSVRIESNSACGSCNGGGLVNVGFDAVLTAINSSIMNNAAAAAGGIFNDSNATSTVINSLIANNTSAGLAGGGGIRLGSGAVNLTSTTVANNMANGLSSGGGGIINGSGTINLTNATIVNNTASSSGAGIRNIGGGTINSRSSIVADNIASDGVGHDVFGTMVSQGYNLIENISGATLSGITTGNILGRDPQLVPLRNNGGFTNTVALQPTSPAIDAGDPVNFPVTDQRGVIRSQDGDLDGTSLPDIGAYERQVTQFVVTNTTDESDGTCDSNCSLREAIGAAGVATTQDNAVVFDPALFGAPNQITLLNAELQLFNNGTLWIKGPGSDLLTISGNSQSRVIYNSPGASSAVSSVRIVGGNGQGSVNSGFGGAIYNPSGRFSVDNAVIGNNTAQNGGGIYSGNTGGGTLFLSNSVIRDNSAVSDGGGLFLSGDSSEFIELSTVGNSAENGGGIYLSRGQLMLDRGDISRNFGGGIRVLSNASASLRQSTVSDNTRYGGIINRGELLIENSTVSGNQSVFPGGGIFSQHFATSTLNNTTISRNRSEIHGGGIFNENGPAGVVNLNNATIVFNSTPGIGGGVFNSIDSVVNARNTIIANNSAEIQSPDFERTLNSQGYNLIGNTAGTTITGVTVGNILQQDPRIDPILRLYGGLTPTHALRPGSPAIDFGDPNTFLPTDQRGVARPQDGDGNGNARSDIGAFERRMIDIVKPAPFDFDGDGKTDVAIFRPNAGSGSAEWWWRRSSDGLVPALQFGSSTDVIAPGDFTGDGKMDITIFRPSTGNWFVLRSEDFSFYSFPFGTAGDTPVTGDFDGDGKADPAVFRPSSSQWFIQRSSDNQTQIAAFGIAGDVPVTADYDGDGKDDIAIYRRNGANGGEWWINRSTAGVFAVVFGTATDLTVPGDYTGDGKADIAFFRPSTGEWFVLRSEDLSFYSFPFGANGDIPSPGDYDGDGRIDPAVFRPSNATWFIQGSTSGTQIQQFGTTGDLPVPSSFVR